MNEEVVEMDKDRKVVTLGEDYGYESKAAPESNMPVDSDAVEQAPILTLDQWLTPDAERPTKWILLPTRGARIQIQAMTQDDFKKVRRDAPMVPKGKGQGKKMIKDEDWIQNQVIMRNVLVPKITDPKLLNHALAGDIAHIVTEISRLSGFDVDTLMRDALEL